MSDWKKAQEWELKWHDNCINSLNEELKQLVYAEKMGLVRTPTPKTPYNFDLGGKRIFDIGGGAYSLLLKCTNYGEATTVADPLMDKFPQWVRDRYETAGIVPFTATGESLQATFIFDEVWIYNVLEHTFNPERILKNARQLGNIIRIFEWIDTPTNIGHIQSLTEEKLNRWLNGEGKVDNVNHDGAVGKAYFGVFKGDNYVTSSN